MKYLISLILILQFLSLPAQKGSCQQIQYNFTKQVDSVINWGIESSVLNNGNPLSKSEEYYILLDSFRYVDSLFCISLQIVYKNSNSIDSAGKILHWEQYLVENTNRYTIISGLKLPVILQEDLYFGILARGTDPQRGDFSLIVDPSYEFANSILIYTDKLPRLNYKLRKVIIK